MILHTNNCRFCNQDIKSIISFGKMPIANGFIEKKNLDSEYFFNYNLKNNTPQIIHDTYYSENIKKPAKVKKIITVHDLIHEKFKNLYIKKRRLRK